MTGFFPNERNKTVGHTINHKALFFALTLYLNTWDNFTKHHDT